MAVSELPYCSGPRAVFHFLVLPFRSNYQVMTENLIKEGIVYGKQAQRLFPADQGKKGGAERDWQFYGFKYAF